jgi:hypothetical protein
LSGENKENHIWPLDKNLDTGTPRYEADMLPTKMEHPVQDMKNINIIHCGVNVTGHFIISATYSVKFRYRLVMLLDISMDLTADALA